MPNQKFVNALNRKAQSCPPIWFMRQAGRYHSHYQSMRAKYSFEELCKKPHLAAETAIGKHPKDTVKFLKKMILAFKRSKSKKI